MNYCDEDAVKEWSCGKRFGKRNDIGDYIKDDVVLHLLESTGYLTYWYNNWFEGICHIGKEEQEGFVCDDNDILKIVEAVKANTEWIRETYSDYVWGLHDARRKEQSL